MNKKAFVKGKYLEPLIGAGIFPVLTLSDSEVENTKENLVTSAVAGGIGTSLLGRYAAKQGADLHRLNRIPRNYIFKGKGRDYVTTGKTSAEKIRNARRAALDHAETEPSFTGTLNIGADFKNSIKPLYEKELNPRIKDVQDTLFGLDFRKVFTPKLNKAQRPLDREAMLSTLDDDLSEASRRG